MKKIAFLTTALTVFAAPAFPAAHSAAKMGYALANDGSQLVVMSDLSALDGATTVDLSSSLAAIAYRPVTGDLIGFSADGAVYGVNPETGELTDMEAAFDDGAMVGGDAAVGFDFNNQIDAVRAVSTDGANLVYFPMEFGDERANTVKRFTDLFYVDGDANAGTTPAVFANAYTNAIPGAKASETFQYAIDAETDSLVTLANNAGELTTVGKIMVDGAEVDVMPMGGFDIVSAEEGDNAAMAILTLAGMDNAGLYEIDLETGAATMMGDTGLTGVTGFAAAAAGM
ncbi:DUF4394 domain-containing protein [Anianabacter salinae]|uniref:DUF4394 domain-containing protein n=1 Tax=Anianabacter salinae TaxID=2851023 RepID=UPI00225DF349|nr:DUF4394 domain-containing protein [Anianabacter salinae]MBV0911700.1 DUF4394 domain-containing protein [Anianabacter salinae]